MKIDLPKLPYAPDALMPAISPLTIEKHYGVHTRNYINTLNELKAGTEFDDMGLDEIVRKSDGKLFNNASQAWNHLFYFFQFSPDGIKEPSGKLREAIDAQFGSLDEFKKKFENAGKTLFGSGWVWLADDAEGKLFILQGKNAENPMTKDLRPIMTFDVWEHAYYIDYFNRRDEYLHRLWDILDWNVIENRYAV